MTIEAGDHIKELDDNIAELKKIVRLGDSLEALRKNKHFRTVIEQEYLKEEAIRLVHLKGNVNVQDEKQQVSINKQIDAIGCLADFLEMVAMRAEGAKEAIDECEDVRAEYEEEGVE